MDLQVISGYRPLLVDGDNVFAWKNNSLYISKDFGTKFVEIKKLPFDLLKSLIRYSSLATRILREGIHDLRILPDGRYVGIIRGHIIVSESDSDVFVITHSFRVGTRPLSLCWHNNYLYYGEYFSNNERGYVDILSSPDGVTWEVVYRFPEKSVRHIHKIISDPYRKCLWVLTGDSDTESAIWYTDDNFTTLTPVIKGGQHARAVSLIPMKGGLIIPMDSPLQKNHINYFDMSDEKISSLGEIESSAFYCGYAGGTYYISTAAEPSAINNEKESFIYASPNGFDWEPIIKGTQDIFSARSKKFFQYPAFSIPCMLNSQYLFAYGRGMSGYDNTMLRHTVTGIK